MKDPGGLYKFTLQLWKFEIDETGRTQRIEVKLEDETHPIDPHDGDAWLKVMRELYTILKPTFSLFTIWSHGNSLGVKNSVAPVKENSFNFIRNHKKYHQLVLVEEKDKVVTSENAAIIADSPDDENCSAITLLFMSEIAEQLRDITKDKKFDLMVMCNCNTQSIDNSYNLRHITNNYFASLGNMQLDGFGFAALIAFLNGTSNISWTKKVYLKIIRLAISRTKGFVSRRAYDAYMKSITSLMIAEYKKLQPERSKSEAITALNLEKIDQMPRLLNKLVDRFTACDQEELSRRYRIIDNLINSLKLRIHGSDSVDIVALFKQVSIQLKDSVFSEQVREFEEFYTKHVVFDLMIGEVLQRNAAIGGYNTVTAYIPRGKAMIKIYVCQYLKRYLNSHFVLDTRWDEFVIDFVTWKLGARPNPQSPILIL